MAGAHPWRGDREEVRRGKHYALVGTRLGRAPSALPRSWVDLVGDSQKLRDGGVDWQLVFQVQIRCGCRIYAKGGSCLKGFLGPMLSNICLPRQNGSSPKLDWGFLFSYSLSTRDCTKMGVQKCTRPVVKVIHKNPMITQKNMWKFCKEEVHDAMRTNIRGTYCSWRRGGAVSEGFVEEVVSELKLEGWIAFSLEIG